MGCVYGYDAEEEEGPIVGKDTFGEPIRRHDRDKIVGYDTFNEPITAREVYKDKKESFLKGWWSKQ